MKILFFILPGLIFGIPLALAQSTTDDSDFDGILDYMDACPYEAENYDGIKDEDGCPEYQQYDQSQQGLDQANYDADSDYDGIYDSKDSCPKEAEDYNGDTDWDGCPESAKTETKPTKKTTEKSTISKNTPKVNKDAYAGAPPITSIDPETISKLEMKIKRLESKVAELNKIIDAKTAASVKPGKTESTISKNTPKVNKTGSAPSLTAIDRDTLSKIEAKVKDLESKFSKLTTTETKSGTTDVKSTLPKSVKDMNEIKAPTPKVPRDIPTLIVKADVDKATGCWQDQPTIRGTSGSDILVGTNGNDVIHGLGGTDVIYGLAGNDVICGGDGDDVIYGGEGDDSMRGNKHSDTIYGGDGTDHIDGGEDRDVLYGGEGASDNILGGTGPDTIIDIDNMWSIILGGTRDTDDGEEDYYVSQFVSRDHEEGIDIWVRIVPAAIKSPKLCDEQPQNPECLSASYHGRQFVSKEFVIDYTHRNR